MRGSGRFRSRPAARGRLSSSFNPLHCGAVVASNDPDFHGIRLSLFQSPSLRGSGRFGVRHARHGEKPRVSIPFIAGQWSLHCVRTPRTRRTPSFNPLHCGAVVASARRGCGAESPRLRFNPLHCGAVVASARRWLETGPTPKRFQSPSLRGSGRFILTKRTERPMMDEFQSPSLRGSGRFREVEIGPRCGRGVSIPFIAGQWSLQPAADHGVGRLPPRFNPLHCGAVVASDARRRRRRGGGRSFNPLHCGAVVASPGIPRQEARQEERVSIPFIAGQWSLPLAWSISNTLCIRVSIPFIAGQWSLPRGVLAGSHTPVEVSIPFIAGQWSLPIPSACSAAIAMSFNPLHCGAVVASWRMGDAGGVTPRVSIPFIAGQWSLQRPLAARRGAKEKVSIPFIAGQWSLPRTQTHHGFDSSSFNPLHCGAVVASDLFAAERESVVPSFNPLHCGAVVASQVRATPIKKKEKNVSIPFIAGQWSLRAGNRCPPARAVLVSIPFIAGQWSLRCSPYGGGRTPSCFNPLHCGAVVASSGSSNCRSQWCGFQSPSLRGSGRFQDQDLQAVRLALVSIPFIAGQWSLLPRTTPSSLFGVLLRKRRLPCDHIICTRLPF